MILRIGTSRTLRTHDHLVTLIRAVVGDDVGDESRSIEWKSGYADLLGHEASFAVADPSSMSGQAVPDSAKVLNALRRYTGPGATAHPSTHDHHQEPQGSPFLV